MKHEDEPPAKRTKVENNNNNMEVSHENEAMSLDNQATNKNGVNEVKEEAKKIEIEVCVLLLLAF